MTTRYAVYYAPAPDDVLWRAGCDWLGRDPAGGATGEPPRIDDIAAITAEARGYGFHATLKPPMRVRDGVSRADVLAALAEVAASVPAFRLPALTVADFFGFLCLRERSLVSADARRDPHPDPLPKPGEGALLPLPFFTGEGRGEGLAEPDIYREAASLQALCDAMVAGLDPLRANLTDAELARRRKRGLSPVEEANLRRWGYPDVFAAWFFHMTLTRRLRPEETAAIRPVADTWFAEALAIRRQVTSVCLFEQTDGGPFRLTERIALAA